MRTHSASDAQAERKTGRCVPVSSVIPIELARAVEKAAARELLSVSAFTRRALQRCVQADERSAA
jgi:hypothetical protein